MAEDVKKRVMGFALIAFTLLGVLFGMNIMGFVFGNVGQATNTVFSDLTRTIVNESGYAIDNTTQTIPAASLQGFEGDFIIITAINGSNNANISIQGNLTVDAGAGTFTGNVTSPSNWSSVNLTYTYDHQSPQEITARSVNNQSLGSISAYSNQSSTQFSTLAIAITLVVLLAVFAAFWIFFMGRGGKGGVSRGNFA